MPERPSIVWLLVDSIRRYPTDKDLRGRLPMMERFGQHSIEFLNVVSSAPSTIMSISAMMTGLPAYFISRNYDDFRFDRGYLTCLNDILKRNGYSCYGFLRGPETREKFRNLLDPVPRRYWAPHLRHAFKWTNQDLGQVLERLLRAGVTRPAFLFFHYNPCAPRPDPAISDTVEEALRLLLDSGFTYENTIYVISSDHGFPDPSTGLTTEWEIEHGLTHDLLLTEDNVMIPLYIRYPGCTPRKIEPTVSSLDIMPTLLDLAGIPIQKDVQSRIKGRSLRSLMDTGVPAFQEERYFRCDARLMYQTGRVTAIRNQRYKYIRFHDKYALPHYNRRGDEAEAFYDLLNDPREKDNRIAAKETSLQQELDRFRKEFERQEREAFAHQGEYLLYLFKGRTGRYFRRSSVAGQSPRNVLLAVEPGTGGYGEIAANVVGRAYPSANVDLLVEDGSAPLPGRSHDQRVFFYQRDPSGWGYTLLDPKPSAHDLIIVVLLNPAVPKSHQFLHLLKLLKGEQTLVLDCNMNVFRRHRYWYYRVRVLLSRTSYFMEEPSMLWNELVGDARFVYQRLRRRMGRFERWKA